MMNPGPLDMIAAKLKPGGEFRFGTDHPIYVRWAMMQMDKRRDFDWQVECAQDFLTRPQDWPETATNAKPAPCMGMRSGISNTCVFEVWPIPGVRVENLNRQPLQQPGHRATLPTGLGHEEAFERGDALDGGEAGAADGAGGFAFQPNRRLMLSVAAMTERPSTLRQRS